VCTCMSAGIVVCVSEHVCTRACASKEREVAWMHARGQAYMCSRTCASLIHCTFVPQCCEGRWCACNNTRTSILHAFQLRAMAKSSSKQASVKKTAVNPVCLHSPTTQPKGPNLRLPNIYHKSQGSLCAPSAMPQQTLRANQLRPRTPTQHTRPCKGDRPAVTLWLSTL